jgi:hypothetical protein
MKLSCFRIDKRRWNLEEAGDVRIRRKTGRGARERRDPLPLRFDDGCGAECDDERRRREDARRAAPWSPPVIRIG